MQEYLTPGSSLLSLHMLQSKLGWEENLAVKLWKVEDMDEKDDTLHRWIVWW